MAAQMADKARLEEQAGHRIDGPTFSEASYKKRRALWRKVLVDKVGGLDLESGEVEFRGRIDVSGQQWIVHGPLLFVRAGTTGDIGLDVFLEITDPDEAQCAVSFLQFRDNIVGQRSNPRTYTQAILAQQGITKDNFHQHAHKLLIQNPWQYED
jgi:hypothetical protein